MRPSEEPLPAGSLADRVLVEKSKRLLTLFREDRPLKQYPISLGGDPLGHKVQEGDSRTPEGHYLIDFHKANSGYYRALHISYPNPADTDAARARGVAPGGAIMIHGIRNGLGWIGPLHRLLDWTAGCIALTDRQMQELWEAIPDGTPIEIRP
ncbi:MAG: L,D-transpeptidase family protein [Pseudomonadota bacterium]